MEYQQLIVPGSSVDLELLNRACIAFTTQDPNDQTYADINNILIQFSKRSDSINFCFPIINGDFHTYTKFLAYQILKTNIMNDWDKYVDDQKENIRNLILQSIVKSVQEGQKNFTISMANQSLIEILKYDWPQDWPMFISSLIQTCNVQGIQFLKDGLDILKMLADEIQSDSSNSQNTADSSAIPTNITRDRQRAMQAGFINELNAIYSLLENAFSLNNAANNFNPTDIEEVNKKALKALISFIPVVGTERLLNTPLVNNIMPLIMNEKFTFHIFSIFGKFCDNLSKSDIDSSAASMFKNSMLTVFRASLEKIFAIIGNQINFNCVESENLFMLVNSTHNFLKLLIPVINMNENQNEIQISFNWIIQISNSQIYDNTDDEVFPELINFWHFISILLYRSPNTPFQAIFAQALSAIIPFLVKNVVSPYSFVDLSSDLDNSNITSLTLNSYESTLYDTMKEMFVILYASRKPDLFAAINSQIQLIQSNRYQTQTINSVSWTLGSLSKITSPEENGQLLNFVIPIFVALINLPNNSNDPTVKENKLTASKALLFLCSQESRYFRNNPAFMSSLIQMIYQFFVSNSSELNIIAIHTFHTLSKSCKQTFLIPIPPSNTTILQNVLQTLPTFINQMRPEHRCVLMSSIADIIRLQLQTQNNEQSYLNIYISHLNSIFAQSTTLIESTLNGFDKISVTTSQSLSYLNEFENNLQLNVNFPFQPPSLIDINLLKNVINSIKILIEIPSNLGTAFLPFFLSIAGKLTQIYEMATNNSAMITTTDFSKESNPNMVKLAQPSIDCYNEIANLVPELFKNVLQILKPNDEQFVPIILSSFFLGINYQSLPPNCCPKRILSMYSALFQFIFPTEVPEMIRALLVKIFHQVFQSIFMKTAMLINNEADTFFDLRIGMCNLIGGIVRGIPSYIFLLTEEQIDIFVQIMIWLTRSPYEKIHLNALKIFHFLISSMFEPSKFKDQQQLFNFLEKYYIIFVSQILSLLNSPFYKFGFDGQTLVLNSLFKLPLASQQFPLIVARANEIFNQGGNDQRIQQLLSKVGSLPEFRSIMRDILVEIKKYSPKDPELQAVEIFKKKRMESLGDENTPETEAEEQTSIENIEDQLFSAFADL